MKGVRGHDGYAGKIRTKHVYVGSGQRYVAPPPGDVLVDTLNKLEMFVHEDSKSYDPLVRSYLIHYQFEAIHPFRDGNGRIGRLLLALTTWLWCNLTLPWLYMSAYFERFKDEYIANMFRISTHGDWDTWIEFCLRGTIVQAKDAMKKCDDLDDLQKKMKLQLGGRPPMSHLIECLFVAPVFTSVELVKWSGGRISLPTARRDIEELEKAGFVQYLDGGRPKTYYVPDILAIAYNEGTPSPEATPDQGLKPASEE
jgi:Fic family protein